MRQPSPIGFVLWFGSAGLHRAACLAVLTLAWQVPVLTSAQTTITSTVLEDNGATANLTDGNQDVYATPVAHPGVLTTAGGYDFTAMSYASLASITSISVTLTLQDGDSGVGEFDSGHLRLALDGTDTGLVLNGFRGNALQDTLTFTGAPLNSATILASLQSDGRLLGTVTTDNAADTIGAPNEIYFGNDANNAVTTLSITGAVPEPGVAAGLGTGALALGATFLRRRREAKAT